MKFRKTLLLGSFAALLMLAACVGAETPPPAEMPAKVEPTEAMMEEKPTEAMMEEKPTEAMMEEKPTEAMMEEKPTEAMMEPHDQEASAMMPGWFSVSLTDVRSGESFQIADFKGKVVLLENMAIWCSTCLRQQNQVVDLHNQLGEREDLISIGIDIDPNEDAAMLKQYIEEKGFDWRYAVAPVEFSREIGQLYGAQLLNPPSAPMLIIDRKGNVHLLPFGVKSAEDLIQALEPFLNEAM